MPAIRDMLSRTDFVGAEVVSCLSNDDLRIKSLKLDASEITDTSYVCNGDVGTGNDGTSQLVNAMAEAAGANPG